MTKNERNCKNCKHYLEHYVIVAARLQAIGGHCINPALNKAHTKNRFALHENCTFWECNESVKTARQESIKEILKDMKLYLAHIEQILESDK
ncbi:MAG: hypothetical protein NC131_05380 [Roseburia sp.]|nr:hypothetical protein [Roseburia sp.]